jgi:hypothetical protein
MARLWAGTEHFDVRNWDGYASNQMQNKKKMELQQNLSFANMAKDREEFDSPCPKKAWGHRCIHTYIP